uniref:PDZ domain-containing protein n=1 Tax=Junco hyemalis TaxID=40217 RepID=A0A8C5J5Q1_JUNHY
MMQSIPPPPFKPKRIPKELEAALGLAKACTEPWWCCRARDAAGSGAFLAGSAGSARLMRCDTECSAHSSASGDGQLPRPPGDTWGEPGGLFSELRPCCCFAIPSMEQLCPFRCGHSRILRADTDKQTLMVPVGPGICLSLGSQSPGLASVPEIIQGMGSLGCPTVIATVTITLFQVCSIYETVPCRALGMVLRYVDGRVFVTEVLPESQAELDEVALAGDILDEINGCCLRSASPGQAGAALQRLKGEPLALRLLRWRWHDGSVFEPLLPYLEALKEKEPQFQLQHSPRHCPGGEGQPRQLQGGRLLYKLRFLGQTSVGTYGGKEVLEGAIPAVLERNLAPRAMDIFSNADHGYFFQLQVHLAWLNICHPINPCGVFSGQKHLSSQDRKGH